MENDRTDDPHFFMPTKSRKKHIPSIFPRVRFGGEVFAAIRGTGAGPGHGLAMDWPWAGHGHAMSIHGLAMPGHGPHFWARAFFLV